MSLGNSFIRDLSTVEMLFVIVLGWTLVGVWQKCIDNLAYNTLKLNRNSTYHTFIVSLVLTVLFLIFILSFSSITADIVESDTPLNPPEPPKPPQPPIQTPSLQTLEEELDNYIKVF